MPLTITPQADVLRSDLGHLTALAGRDLAALSDAELAAALAELIYTYGAAAGSLAADWYDELRDQKGVAGQFRAVVPEIRDPGVDALLGWAATFSDVRAMLEGGVQRRILNVARETITGSSVADPKSHGWQRVGHGECGWCLMLISRGAVYSKATADFSSHDSCRCTAQPAWGGQEIAVKPFTPSERNISDADRARAKAWIAANL